MSSEAPTKALAAFEPFVQWLLSASSADLSSVPEEIFSGFNTASEAGDGDIHVLENPYSTPKARRLPFDEACKARLALAEVECESETAWDQLSCVRREWDMLGEKLLALQDERNENRKYIAVLERRIMKLLQDRDLAIGETYTTEKSIQDAILFNAKQLERRKLQGEEQNKVRVASALRKLLLLRGADESANSRGRKFSTASSSPKFTEKDVQRLHKELADSNVAAAVAKAEQEERRQNLRQAERRCIALKLAFAQTSEEEDDLRTSLHQLTRARCDSVNHLHLISLFSSAAMPLQPPPAPTAGSGYARGSLFNINLDRLN